MSCACACPRYEIARQQQFYTSAHNGDCFRACVAMVLRLPQADLPNFCWDGPEETWWEDFQDWLAERGLMALEYKLLPATMGSLTPGVPCILVGPSPRIPGIAHSVVGVTAASGFHYLYDPHADEQYLAGEPAAVLLFAALRPDLIARQFVV